MMNFFTAINLGFLLIANFAAGSEDKFLFGSDVLLNEKLDLIKEKKLGIITNHTAVLSNGTHLVDSLFLLKNIHITALFGPEHGIRGDNSAGEKITNSVDSKTGIPVFSLYGKDKKPSREMLKNVEALIFDIQDVGARFYTYISTLYYAIQAAAENHIPIIVLDRPNPINGIYVDGPIRKPEQSSFVGIAPLPIVHGMTVGELANYFVGEKLIGENLNVDLTVVKMKNWNRNLYYDDILPSWISPSPNIPSVETAIVYPGTCLIEGINVSEGRGTNEPFLKIGAPFILPDDLLKELQNHDIPGVKLETTEFIPKEIPGKALNPKFKNENCKGIRITVIDRNKFESVKFGIKLIAALYKLYSNELKFRESSFDKLSGDSSIRNKIIKGLPADQIINSYEYELHEFKQIRKKYLLY